MPYRRRVRGSRGRSRLPLVGWTSFQFYDRLNPSGTDLLELGHLGEVGPGAPVWTGSLSQDQALPARNMTLRRIRGVISVDPDRSSDASGSEIVYGVAAFVGRQGTDIADLSEDALLAGSLVLFQAVRAHNSANSAGTGLLASSGPVDVKAMRKIRKGEALIFFAWVAASQGLGSQSSAQFAGSLQLLFSDSGE